MKAVPLLSGEDFDYLLALKQEYRGTIRESPYFMKMSDKKRDIVRYSDKYSVGNQDNQTNWQPGLDILKINAILFTYPCLQLIIYDLSIISDENTNEKWKTPAMLTPLLFFHYCS